MKINSTLSISRMWTATMVVQEALLHVFFFPYGNFQEKSGLSCTLENKAGHVDFLCLPALFKRVSKTCSRLLNVMFRRSHMEMHRDYSAVLGNGSLS
jgi:hypothetical protein